MHGIKFFDIDISRSYLKYVPYYNLNTFKGQDLKLFFTLNLMYYLNVKFRKIIFLLVRPHLKTTTQKERRVVFFFEKQNTSSINTRPKPVEHGYVFSMAVGTIWEGLKLVLFFVGGSKVDWGGGGAGSFLK